MRLVPIILIQFLVATSITGYCREGRFIKFKNKHLQYMGRIKMAKDHMELYWSGSSVKLSFTGSSVKAILKDEKANNYYEVIVDDAAINKFKPDSNKTIYTLVQDLPRAHHTIELSKCTEWDRGKTFFYGFEIDGKKVYTIEKPKRRMEFYGNSITCGFAVEDTLTDSGVSKYENNFLSYASITARNYHAQYHCISKSGIGLMVSFSRLIMPEMYNRLNAADSLSAWKFSKYQPQVVVIEVLENDAAIVTRPDNLQFIRVFGKTPPTKDFIVNAYANFIRTLREKYPDSYIICSLGSMGSVKEGSLWPGYIKSAAEEVNDAKVLTFFFRYKGRTGHPKVKDHKIMAADLIAFIDHNIGW